MPSHTFPRSHQCFDFHGTFFHSSFLKMALYYVSAFVKHCSNFIQKELHCDNHGAFASLAQQEVYGGNFQFMTGNPVIHIYNSYIFTIIEYAIDREQEILFILSLMMNTGIICSSNFYGFTVVNILVSISWCTCTLATLF